MEKEELKIGVESNPRFEFRSFGQCFCDQHKRMARLSSPVPENVWQRTSEEYYIVTRSTSTNNLKIRDSKMDIKTFVQTVDGFEQWKPLMKGEFPLKKDVIEQSVFPPLGLDASYLKKESYTIDEFLKMVRMIHDAAVVRVAKQRYGYMVEGVICEVADVLINGARVSTVSCESTSVEDLRRVVFNVGLEGVENINYLEAIKRVIGFSPKPLANEDWCPCGC